MPAFTYEQNKNNIYNWRIENKQKYNEYTRGMMARLREYKKMNDYEHVARTFRYILLLN
jgi:alpha-tubulin suppressor-like RCC1 family protein